MGLRILVVEDEMTIAMMIEDMLAELGHEVIGVAMRLKPAVECATSMQFDFAILDVNLDGQNSFPVADILAARQIPFAFATGYGSSGLSGAHAERGVIKKPFLMKDLEAIVVRATSAAPPRS